MHNAIADNRIADLTNFPVHAALKRGKLAGDPGYFNQCQASECRGRLQHLFGVLTLHIENLLADRKAEAVAGEGGQFL